MKFLELITSAFKKDKRTATLIGASAIVTSDISADTKGKIKAGGNELSALSVSGTDIPKSAKVIIKEIKNETAMVEVVRF